MTQYDEDRQDETMIIHPTTKHIQNTHTDNYSLQPNNDNHNNNKHKKAATYEIGSKLRCCLQHRCVGQ